LAEGLKRMLSAPSGVTGAAFAAERTVRFSSAVMAEKYLKRYQRIREEPS
jgi:hypothetical protein